MRPSAHWRRGTRRQRARRPTLLRRRALLRTPPTPTADRMAPLTAAALAAAPPGVQKQMIGERLFRRVEELQPRLARKITGMILGLSNGVLLGLLEPGSRLEATVDEALRTLTAEDAAAAGPPPNAATPPDAAAHAADAAAAGGDQEDSDAGAGDQIWQRRSEQRWGS